MGDKQVGFCRVVGFRVTSYFHEGAPGHTQTDSHSDNRHTGFLFSFLSSSRLAKDSSKTSTPKHVHSSKAKRINHQRLKDFDFDERQRGSATSKLGYEVKVNKQTNEVLLRGQKTKTQNER